MSKKQQNAAKIGDNSGVSGARLKNYIESVERIQDQISILALEIKDIFATAKSDGFDPKTMKKQIADRKIPEDKLNEQYELLDLYNCAVANA